jgi:hypothetical protein
MLIANRTGAAAANRAGIRVDVAAGEAFSVSIGSTLVIVDDLPAVNCEDSSCQSAVSIAAHAAIAVGGRVVEVCAEQLCRIMVLALRLALMRATDLREGGCLRPRRLRANALRPDFGDSSTS